MSAQDYKEFSIKYSFCEPASDWNFYYHSVIDALKSSSDTLESTKAVTLCKQTFQDSIDHLPRSKRFMQRYWYCDSGFCGSIITEQYAIGFEVRYFDDETIALYYDDGNGQVTKTFATFDALCEAADTLINGEFDIFRDMSESYKTVKDTHLFYKEHITQRYDEVLCDSDVIYSGRGSSRSACLQNWKI